MPLHVLRTSGGYYAVTDSGTGYLDPAGTLFPRLDQIFDALPGSTAVCCDPDCQCEAGQIAAALLDSAALRDDNPDRALALAQG